MKMAKRKAKHFTLCIFVFVSSPRSCGYFVQGLSGYRDSFWAKDLRHLCPPVKMCINREKKKKKKQISFYKEVLRMRVSPDGSNMQDISVREALEIMCLWCFLGTTAEFAVWSQTFCCPSAGTLFMSSCYGLSCL